MLMYHKFVFFDVFSHSNGDNVETNRNFVETKFNSYFQYIVLENFSILDKGALLYNRKSVVMQCSLVI